MRKEPIVTSSTAWNSIEVDAVSNYDGKIIVGDECQYCKQGDEE